MRDLMGFVTPAAGSAISANCQIMSGLVNGTRKKCGEPNFSGKVKKKKISRGTLATFGHWKNWLSASKTCLIKLRRSFLPDS